MFTMQIQFALALLVISVSGEARAATSFYVSSSTGDDRNSGKKPSAPWRTLTKVNQRNLSAGDKILLKAGDKFLDAGLVFLSEDRGRPDNPIIVDIYGGEEKAIILPPRGQHGISVYNTGGLTVRNLRLLGRGPEESDATERVGVSLWCDLRDGRRLAGLRFEGLHISWFYQGMAIGANDASYSGFSDVAIEDCTVVSCLADGIVTYGQLPGSADAQSHRNLQIRRTRVSKCHGDPTLKGPHSGSGIIMSGTKGGLIEYCVAHDNGGGTNDASGGGPVGIWCWGADSVIIQHCLVYNQKSTPGVQDGGGFDIDGGSTNCVIQYCYSYNNEGYGYLVCAFEGAAPIVNATVRYNISWNDGRERSQSGLGIWNGNPTSASCRGVVFHHNLVICDATAGSAVKMGYASNPLEAAFYNNVFVRTGGRNVVDIERPADTIIFKGNAYWAIEGPPQWVWGQGLFHSLADWRNASHQPETHRGQAVGLQTDPLLTDLARGFTATRWEDLASVGAFVPLPDSPLRDGGLDLGSSQFGLLDGGQRDFRGRSFGKENRTIGPLSP